MTGETSEFITGLSWTVAGLLLVVAVSGLSRRVGWSAPLVLVAVGVGVGALPWTPEVRLDPDVVLAGVLPALLFAAALQTSFLEVRARVDAVLWLSVGLVLFTVLVVGVSTWWLLPAVGPAVAFAFGAILAPTDAVSVGALTGSGRMPRGLGRLLESEGLLNDATALVALNTAVGAAVATSGLVATEVLRDFAVAVLAGTAGGVAVAFVIVQVRRRLRAPVLDTSLSLATPYVAYLPVAAIGGSGFLAVVLSGIWLAHRAPSFQSAESRVAERINWRTVSYLLENAVFLLIGLQLPGIVAAASEDTTIGLAQGIGIIAGVYAAMVLARFAYVFALTLLYRAGPARLRERRWDWRTAFVISFAGVRGVVTLAAVFLLPDRPGTGFLQLAAFVIVVLSLLQGLGTGPLVRLFRLPLPNADQDRLQIRTLIAEAQDAALQRLEHERTDQDPEALVVSLQQSSEYRRTIAAPDEDGLASQPDSYARLRLLMLDSERRAVLQARREGRYEDTVIEAVLGDYDSIEAALKRSRRRDLPSVVPVALHFPRARTRFRRRR